MHLAAHFSSDNNQTLVLSALFLVPSYYQTFVGTTSLIHQHDWLNETTLQKQN